MIKQELDSGPATHAANEMGEGALVVRSSLGGILMGLANLVPGISGGTMLLAAGIYPRFISAVAEVTRFRFRFRSLLMLACVVVAAGLSILLLAGTLKELVVERRWIMYSLFVGLTLGGIPVVWKLVKTGTKSLWISCALAFLAMVALAVLQAAGVVGNSGANLVTLFVAGLAGASAMILPGLSGGYLLLLMGQYVPILSAIDGFKEALKAKDISAAMIPATTVMLPVALGVIVGVAVVGNLLEWLLKRFHKATLGALLGLLIGSTVGLWPFQEGSKPNIGDTFKGQVITAESLNDLDPEDWPTHFFRPTTKQALGSLTLIAIGFGLTVGIARIGDPRDSRG